MKIVDIGDTLARIDISRNELLIIKATLNEVCNGIELFEFETRVGAARDRVRELLKEVGLLIDEWDTQSAERPFNPTSPK